MKAAQNWLKQSVDFNWSPEELTGRLNLKPSASKSGRK
jgi:hypothetical protein